MPNIKTIKPAGGGDYTTLSAWEDYADDQTTADQWAECYSGNLGAVTITGWASTPTSSVYPRIYAANGNEGTLTGGTYAVGSGKVSAINLASISHIHIDGVGVRMDGSHIGGSAGILVGGSCVGLNMNKCVVQNGPSAVSNRNLLSRTYGVDGSEDNIRNCLFCNKAATGGSGSIFSSNLGFSFTLDYLNNTVIGNGIAPYGLYLSMSGVNTYVLNIKNNVIDDCATADVVEFLTSGATPTYNASNNATSDGTASSVLGGSNNQDNIVAADFFNDPSSDDYTPKITGVGFAGGITTTNKTSLNRQPRHDPPDIGAYEQPYRTSPILSPPTPVSLLRIFERDLRPKRYGEHRTGVNRLNVYARR